LTSFGLASPSVWQPSRLQLCVQASNKLHALCQHRHVTVRAALLNTRQQIPRMSKSWTMQAAVVCSCLF